MYQLETKFQNGDEVVFNKTVYDTEVCPHCHTSRDVSEIREVSGTITCVDVSFWSDGSTSVIYEVETQRDFNMVPEERLQFVLSSPDG